MATSTKHRFSLLLLEDGESYQQDWVGLCTPPPGKLETSGSIRGRLRLCSGSLIFDPDDQRTPILKFPFGQVVSLEAESDSVACLTTTHCVRCKENGVDAPYVHDRSTTAVQWRFCLAFAGLASLLVSERCS